MKRGLSCACVGVFALALNGLSTGCSSDNKVVGPAGAADCSVYAEVGDSACEMLCGVSNADFCDAVAAPLDCGNVPSQAQVDVCGVPVPKPQEGGQLLELQRSVNVEEFGGSGPPDLSCFTTSNFPAPPQTSETVTLTGIVKVFSAGCDSAEVTVEVFTVVRDGSDNDGMPGELIGTAVTTAEDCTLEGVAEVNDDCTQYDGQRWECTYSYPGVPSETELLIRTQGSNWAPLYEYNVFVRNGDIQNGAYDKDIRSIARDDYTLIPQTAIGKLIEPGNGAVGGEVHDCGDVRLENAVVDVNADRSLTYFTDDETTPLPDKGRTATSTLGLYSALDVKPGKVTVAAAGVVDGALVGIGVVNARVFADAITSVTFRGLGPYQVE